MLTRSAHNDLDALASVAADNREHLGSPVGYTAGDLKQGFEMTRTTSAPFKKLQFLRAGLPAIAALSIGASTCVADWPQWRGPERNGFVESGPLIEQLPSQGLAPKWKFDSFPGGTSGGWSSPIISGNHVYAYSHTKVKNPAADDLGPAKYPWLAPEKRTGMTDAEYADYEVKRRDENEARAKAFRFDERMICVDLDSGDVIWERSHQSKYTRFTHSGTPCVSQGKLFVLGAERTAYCYDAKSGDVLWSKRLPGDFRDEFFASSFVVSGDVALVSCGALTALSTKDGAILWQGDAELEYQSHSSPVVWNSGSEPVAIVNSRGGTTKAFRVADGKKLWELESGAGSSTPIVAKDLLLTYGSSRKSGLSAYQLNRSALEKEPELVWQFQRAADSGSTPVVRGDAVFVQGDKRLAKVKLADGKAVWQTTMKISNPRYTSLIAAGDQVFYSWEGILSFSANAEKYQELYDAEVDSDSVLIGEEDLRKKLKLDEIASGDGGQAEAEKVWQAKAIRSGPLGCSTPAVSDGKMVVRLRDALVCFDLRQ